MRARRYTTAVINMTASSPVLIGHVILVTLQSGSTVYYDIATRLTNFTDGNPSLFASSATLSSSEAVLTLRGTGFGDTISGTVVTFADQSGTALGLARPAVTVRAKEVHPAHKKLGDVCPPSVCAFACRIADRPSAQACDRPMSEPAQVQA